MNNPAPENSGRARRTKRRKRLGASLIPNARGGRIALVALVAPAATGIIMLAQLFFTAVGPIPCGFWKNCPEPSTASPSSTPSAKTEPSEDDTHRDDAGASTVGSCIADDAVVPCDSSHQEQIFADHDCSPRQLIEFLGGNPDVDVLRPDLDIERRSEHECSVPVPNGMSWSAQGALATDGGDLWRWCRNSVTDQDVPCSEAHDAEVVSLYPQPREEELTCRTDAEQYMDRKWSGVSTDLVLSSRGHQAGDICVVQPRGNNSLDGSIRRIGTRALPLSDPL